MSLKLMSSIVSSAVNASVAPAQKDTCVEKDGATIVDQLLHCVKTCQCRYGGRKELATELDSCVLDLCYTLEAVLLHGFRQSLNYKHTVAGGFHIHTETPAFWPFIQEHLTIHERERFTLLKQIWTDTGRGRAWLKAALNERSLERAILQFVGNSVLLERYYEDWAILRNQEYSNLLPTMAAGLASILFAMNIDQPELNSKVGASDPRSKVMRQSEPVIQGPSSSKKDSSPTKSKKKSKIRDAVILSATTPETSEAIVPPPTITTPTRTSSNSSSLEAIQQLGDNLSKSSSSSIILKDDEDSSELQTEEDRGNAPGRIVPVVGSIGELTPVSVEVDSYIYADAISSNSDDLGDLDVSTDVSAVLTAVESRTAEDLQRKQARIDALTVENGRLQQQVKRYISAIQMLRVVGDDDGGNKEEVLNILTELDLNDPVGPNVAINYKYEAELYERKLIQVAEMHGELMDFNGVLQKQLVGKDVLLERLRGELESLRGPLPPLEALSAQSEAAGVTAATAVSVWIPSAYLTGTGAQSYHVYQVYLRAGSGDEWNIYRRYAEFYKLQAELKKLDPAVGAFDFPPKVSLRKRDGNVVEDRRKRLQNYLRQILSHWPELAQCNSRFLLEQHLAFFKDKKRNSDQQQSSRGSTFPPRKSAVDENRYTGL